MENDADASRDTDFRAARPVGRNPYLICRFVSGQDCNRRMQAEGEHGGDPTHVRVVHVDSLAMIPTRSRRVRYRDGRRRSSTRTST